MKVTLPTISDKESALAYLNGKVGYCMAQHVRPAYHGHTVEGDLHCRFSEAEDAVQEGRIALAFFRSAGYLDARLRDTYEAIFDKIVSDFGDYASYCSQEKARAV